MSEFPVPLDNLIAYVKSLHPDGGPLENVADAFTVSAQLDERSDALIGHFVDQARRSGASWNQIGTAMGVSKQAAQKRFVSGRMSDLSDLSDLLPRGPWAAGRSGRSGRSSGRTQSASGRPAWIRPSRYRSGSRMRRTCAPGRRSDR